MEEAISLKSWLDAFRLRTLPLALSSIGMGSFLAASFHAFQWSIFLLSSFTTISLQILSNLANDYGDSQHGADSVHRTGPFRAVQAGHISASSMKNAMLVFTALSFISGISLIFMSFKLNLEFLIFLLLGILAIAAAIKYTAGDRPYGYAGLGDVSVFLFFGWLGVTGSFYLYTKTFTPDLLLPASACGFFSTAVLNINNIRDINSDALAGKYSIPVRIGEQKAKLYHLGLLSSGAMCALLYTLIHRQHPLPWIFLLVIPLLVFNGYKIYTSRPATLDPYLKQMAITTLLFVLSFGIGLL